MTVPHKMLLQTNSAAVNQAENKCTTNFTFAGMIHINSSNDWLIEQLQFQSPVA